MFDLIAHIASIEFIGETERSAHAKLAFTKYLSLLGASLSIQQYAIWYSKRNVLRNGQRYTGWVDDIVLSSLTRCWYYSNCFNRIHDQLAPTVMLYQCP